MNSESRGSRPTFTSKEEEVDEDEVFNTKNRAATVGDLVPVCTLRPWMVCKKTILTYVASTHLGDHLLDYHRPTSALFRCPS